MLLPELPPLSLVPSPRRKASEDERPQSGCKGTQVRGWRKPVQSSLQQRQAPPAQRRNLSAPSERLQAPGHELPGAAPAATRRLPPTPLHSLLVAAIRFFPSLSNSLINLLVFSSSASWALTRSLNQGLSR